jgi:hypothetical protein
MRALLFDLRCGVRFGLRCGVLLSLMGAAGCLGRYNAPPEPAPAAPAGQSPAGTTGAPTPPSPSPSSPAPSDGGVTPSPPSSDGGSSSSSCAQLGACCDQLPADQIQGCLDRVAGLDEQLCQVVLDGLEQAGYCQ